MTELDAAFSQYQAEAHSTLNKFYYKVIAMVEEDNTKLDSNAYERLLKVCSGLLSVYISKAIQKTIEHIKEVTATENRIPYLKLSLKFSNSLVLSPNSEDVFFIYSLFLSKLVDMGKSYPVLETVKIKNYPDKKIPLHITDDLSDDIGENICMMFEPVENYVSTLDADFKEIFRGFSLSNASDSDFRSGLTKIEHYQKYINKSSSMCSSEYFAIGQLILSEYVKSIKDSLSEIIENIFLKLCDLHMSENEDICDAFDAIKEEALRRPENTEDLIQQGKSSSANNIFCIIFYIY